MNEKLILITARKNITDTELAEKAGVGRTTIYRLKKGKTKPDYETLQKIAKALDVEVNEII